MMNKKDEAVSTERALKLALEALDHNLLFTSLIPGYNGRIIEKAYKAINKALAEQPAQPEPRMLGAFSVIKALRDRLYRPSANVLNQGCSGCGDTSTEDEIKRLKDLLGKANALCRIRQDRIKELEEALREVQDWEALAADQALTISLLRSEQKSEYWKEEARRCAQNADFWLKKYESVTVQRTRGSV